MEARKRRRAPPKRTDSALERFKTTGTAKKLPLQPREIDEGEAEAGAEKPNHPTRNDDGGSGDDGATSGGMRDRVASRQLPMSPSESAMNGAPEGELYEVTLLTSDKVH